METTLTRIIEEMQKHAKLCETVAQDSAEEALTGESNEKAKKGQDAQVYLIKAQVWLEAEALVRTFLEPAVPMDSPSAQTAVVAN